MMENMYFRQDIIQEVYKLQAEAVGAQITLSEIM